MSQLVTHLTGGAVKSVEKDNRWDPRPQMLPEVGPAGGLILSAKVTLHSGRCLGLAWPTLTPAAGWRSWSGAGGAVAECSFGQSPRIGQGGCAGQAGSQGTPTADAELVSEGLGGKQRPSAAQS